MDCTKIILSSYSNLERAIEAIDKRICHECLHSQAKKTPAFDIADGILRLMERKDKLYELKYKTDKVFSLLSEEETDLLYCKYLDKKPKNKFKFSLRSYFRKQANLLKKLDEYFSYIGITDEKFFSDFKGDPFIKCAIYKAEDIKRLRCLFLENADEQSKSKRKTA